MKIRIASDLHLEGFRGMHMDRVELNFLPRDARDCESVLALTGDISSDKDQLYAFLEYVTPRFKRVFFVPGNHEYYRHDYVEWNAEMQDMLGGIDGLSFVTGGVNSTVYNDTKFIMSTLWADGGILPSDHLNVESGLADFMLIKLDKHRFKVQDMINIYKQNRQGIEDELKASDGMPTVLLTHHLPTRKCVHSSYLSPTSDGINGGFVGNCEYIMATYRPKLWIHGHTHKHVDIMFFDTNVLANPCGYRKEYSDPDNVFFDKQTFCPRPFYAHI